MKSSINLNNRVYHLELPLNLINNEQYKLVPVFKGITKGLLEIECHISATAKNYSPHGPHTHDEEEILFLLSGNVNLIHPGNKNQKVVLKEGQFVYYPAYFPHTFTTSSDMPANFLAIKWKTSLKNKNQGLNYGCFCVPTNLNVQKNKKSGFKTFIEGQTLYLKKLQCHMFVMNPGGGIKAHRDLYDVLTIILEGEVETLGEKAAPFDVIFYPTGKPHGISNPGVNTAREISFEFHPNKISSIYKIFYILNYYFHKMKKLSFWKRKIKKILGLK